MSLCSYIVIVDRPCTHVFVALISFVHCPTPSWSSAHTIRCTHIACTLVTSFLVIIVCVVHVLVTMFLVHALVLLCVSTRFAQQLVNRCAHTNCVLSCPCLSRHFVPWLTCPCPRLMHEWTWRSWFVQKISRCSWIFYEKRYVSPENRWP
jgi:hypothetical protein